MRGKVGIYLKGLIGFRITPAHAGKSLDAVKNLVAEKDHPRACGEKAEFFVKDSSEPGSPPRMRGKG